MTDSEIVDLMGAGFFFSQKEDYVAAMDLARRAADAAAKRERERCERLAWAEPCLPGPIPDHVRQAVEAALKNGKLEEVCRHFASTMRSAIASKIREGSTA